MSHIDEGQLHAFLDGEVVDERAERLQEHVNGCRACAARLDEAARVRALGDELLGELSSTGAPEWGELVARAAAPAPALAPSAAPRRWLVPALAWAATLVLAFTLGWQARQDGELTNQLMLRDSKKATVPPAVVAEEPQSLDDALETDALVLFDEPATDRGAPGAAATEPDAKARQEALLERPSEPAPAATGPQQRALTPDPPSAVIGATTGELREAGQVAAPERENARRAAEGVAAPAPATEARLQAEGQVAEPPQPNDARLRQVELDDSAMAKRQDLDVVSEFLFAEELRPVSFETIEPEHAAEVLGAEPLRLVGAELLGAATGPAAALGNDETGAAVLQLSYADPVTGAEVTLLQQYLPAEAGRRPAAQRALRSGAAPRASFRDADATVDVAGMAQLLWRTEDGYVLLLRARLPQERLRQLAAQIR